MHKFDLQRALAGEPLITRGGLPAGNFRENKQKNLWHPYLADVGDGDFWFYEANGTAPGAGYGDELDLFMLHETSGAEAASSATHDLGTGAGFPFEWQPIETAPKDGTSALIFAPFGIVEAWFCGDDGSYQWVCYDDKFQLDEHEPTHWMPLPAPPTE